MSAVPPQTCATLLDAIDANTRRLDALTGGLSNAQFNWRPAPGIWSIGQNVGHLIATDGGPGLDALRASIAAGRAAHRIAPGPFTCSTLATKFILTQVPPVTTKYKAPKVFQPPPDLAPATTLAAYHQICADLRATVVSADGLDLGRVTTLLPALPPVLRSIIRMTLVARLTLITIHATRHLWQIEQIRQNPAFPPS